MARRVPVRADVPTPKEDWAATEAVVNYVRGLILRGECRPGQRLPPERELVRQIGVSRTTIRAGLQSLAAKGLLVIRHGSGTFVADGPMILDSEPLSLLAALHGYSRREMFEARRILEVGVASLAAERAKGDALAAIAEEVTGMFASLDDPQAFLVHDIKFHRAVAAGSGNPILASIVEMVSGLFYELRRGTANRARDLRPSADIHHRIYKAIREHAPAKAASLMNEHLLAAEQQQDVEDQAQAGRKATAQAGNLMTPAR